MGIDIAIIITLLPISILLAIAFSPASEHILTANSVIIAIPVILSKMLKNCLLIYVLSEIDCSKLIIPVIFYIDKIKINTPAIIETYIAYSGLYCFKMIAITNAIRPIPIIFIISSMLPPLINQIRFELFEIVCLFLVLP